MIMGGHPRANSADAAPMRIEYKPYLLVSIPFGLKAVSAPRSRTQIARPDPARHDPHVNRIGTVASRQNSTISYGHNAGIESRRGEILRKHTKALTSIAGHVEP